MAWAVSGSNFYSGSEEPAATRVRAFRPADRNCLKPVEMLSINRRGQS
jgi:hypothetical protein